VGHRETFGEEKMWGFDAGNSRGSIEEEKKRGKGKKLLADDKYTGRGVQLLGEVIEEQKMLKPSKRGCQQRQKKRGAGDTLEETRKPSARKSGDVLKTRRGNWRERGFIYPEAMDKTDRGWGRGGQT